MVFWWLAPLAGGLPALEQPLDVGACADMVIVAYRAQEKDPMALVRALNGSCADLACALDATRLPASANLHAEAACTQRFV